MSPNDFRKKHHAALKIFLSSEVGKDMLVALHQMRPLFVTTGLPHIHTESSGAVRGFENCERAIPFLSTPVLPNEEIEMTYGVVEKK